MDTKKIYTIDASNRRLGRVASEAAHILMGKNSPDFERHVVIDAEVRIENVSKLHIDEKREKVYLRYSGYPSGLKKESIKKVLKEKGVGEIIRRAVYGMLPSNKLRKRRMKLLSVSK